MNENQQLLNQFKAVFRAGIKPHQTIGGEFEHFIVHRDTLKSYDYYMENGIREILVKLKSRGWHTNEHDEKILSLENAYGNITLEPGGQLELSVFPMASVEAVENVYREFIEDLKSVLLPEQAIVGVAFHPASTIEEIPFIPKSRYRAMSEYFMNTGHLAHHMMKGTASTQVGIDYDSEEDCGVKFRVFTLLAPILAAYFDSGARWQGKVYSDYSIRTKIWMETDPRRSGAPDAAFALPWHFSDYGKYILQVPPILMQYEERFFETKEQTWPEIEKWLLAELKLNQLPKSLVDHALTMAFPDVRLKNFLEIRMADALPYPYNFAVLELIWAIAYTGDILNDLYKWSQTITQEDLSNIREAVVLNGLQAQVKGKSAYDFMDEQVMKIIQVHPELKHLKSYHDLIITMPNGYSHYLKQLSDKDYLEEVEVK